MTETSASQDEQAGQEPADTGQAMPVRKIRQSIRPWHLAALAGIIIVVAFGVRAWMQPKDYQTALLNGQFHAAERLLLPKAEAGDMNAQNSLGNLYYLGLGPKQDFSKASKWYLKAALAGNGNAMINISHLYRRGLGVPRDNLRALAWLTHARSANYEASEKQIKWHSVRLQMSISQLMYVRETYKTVRSLDPDIKPDAR
jgi:hypothetical protein